MKKIISLIFLSLILVGCANISNQDLKTELLNVIDFQESSKYYSRHNNYTEYVDYYLPSDTVELDGDLTTFIFRYNDSIILYNINIADLINQKYYSNEMLDSDDYFYNGNYLFLEHEGTVETGESNNIYNIKIYEIEDEYLLSYSDVSSQIYAYSTKGDVKEVLRHIFILAKNAKVEKEKVITTFSDKDVISATKKPVSLFNYVYPTSGYLSDLMNSPIDSTENSDQNNNIEDNYYEEDLPEEDFEDNFEINED